MIKIEHNIPIPDRYGDISRALKSVKCGDSFVLPTDRRTLVGVLARRMKVPITARSIGDGKIRVWRVK